jgi:hypothetical protein
MEQRAQVLAAHTQVATQVFDAMCAVRAGQRADREQRVGTQAHAAAVDAPAYEITQDAELPTRFVAGISEMAAATVVSSSCRRCITEGMVTPRDGASTQVLASSAGCCSAGALE